MSTVQSSFHLLMADDDQDEFYMFKDALKEVSAYLEVSHVESCDALLEYLKTKRPTLVFLDINMPGKNGIDCLKVIRGSEAYRSIPVVIFSTSGNPRQIEQCFNLGANYY